MHFKSRNLKAVSLSQFLVNRRRRRLVAIHRQPLYGTSVVYTVPTPVYVEPVHNNFPNSRHVAPSILVVEQRLNQHYSDQQQGPPAYNTLNPIQQQRY